MGSEGKTVVVTGGLGEAGAWVTDLLDTNGWNVICIDLETPPGNTEKRSIEFRASDLTNQGEAWQLILDTEPEAVVHMAAIPRVGIRSGTTTFETNVTSTYNVLVAAGEVGAKVVWTSSNSVYGQVFAEQPSLPDYFPIDEDHPQRPTDAYGTSKAVGEIIASMVSRRYNVPVASIRPTLIQYPGQYRTRDVRETFDPMDADPDGGFWSYIDCRDVARAIEAGLTTEISGHEPFLIAAENNFLGRETAAVTKAVYGDLPSESELTGDESAYDLSKAKEVLSWEPKHTWETAERENVDYPEF